MEWRQQEVIGANLRLIRRRAGVSMNVVAKAIGVSKSTICNIEDGKTKKLFTSTARLLCQHYGTELTSLLTIEIAKEQHD